MYHLLTMASSTQVRTTFYQISQFESALYLVNLVGRI